VAWRSRQRLVGVELRWVAQQAPLIAAADEGARGAHRGWAIVSKVALDSQDDTKSADDCGPVADGRGSPRANFDRAYTLVHDRGRLTHGLQNRGE
jgi:hypothetical protein